MTSNLSNFFIFEFNWPHLNGLQLPHPSSHIRIVDMILEEDIFFYLIQNSKILGNQYQSSTLNSKLGWHLSGRVAATTQNENQSVSLIYCHTLLALENLMKNSWKVKF